MIHTGGGGFTAIPKPSPFAQGTAESTKGELAKNRLAYQKEVATASKLEFCPVFLCDTPINRSQAADLKHFQLEQKKWCLRARADCKPLSHLIKEQSFFSGQAEYHMTDQGVGKEQGP